SSCGLTRTASTASYTLSLHDALPIWNVSVKLTGLGLKLDYALCRDNVVTVVADAATRNNFVRIDMEDSSTTDDTLRIYRELRERSEEHTSELQSRGHLVCRLLLEKKK